MNNVTSILQITITIMSSPDPYGEFISQQYICSQYQGSRSYPAVSYEVLLLEQARQRASRREEMLFRQLTGIFDWKMSALECDDYLHKLRTGYTLVLTDLSKSIIWTSQNFLTMTGYTSAEILGKKSSLLQGPDTDPAVLMRIGKALGLAQPAGADLVNYRKNGQTYVCRVHIEPLYDNRQNLTHFLAVEREVPM